MRITHRIHVVVLAAAALSSCVSVKNVPLTSADAARLKGASVAVTKREVPSFAAMTASKAALGAFGVVGGVAGAAAMVNAGNEIIRSNGVQDPADRMGNSLASALASARGGKVATTGGKTSENDPKAVAASYPGSDFVLDVRTINWSSVYFPTSWGHYRVIYSAQLRLIETKTGKVVAEGFHARVPEKTADSPTQDQLLANGAALLKQEIQKGAAECEAHFRKTILGL